MRQKACCLFLSFLIMLAPLCAVASTTALAEATPVVLLAVQEKVPGLLAACPHTVTGYRNYGPFYYEQWDSRYHVRICEADLYCVTCNVTLGRTLLETMAPHTGAPCTACGYDPYA